LPANNPLSTHAADSTDDPFAEIKATRRRFGHLCRGVGLEIGPLHIPTEGVAPDATVLYMDRVSTRDLVKYFESNPGIPTQSIVPIDVIGDAMTLPFERASLDFLIANHVLEHLSNPLKALCEWHRALKQGGILYLSLPDKRFCAFCAGPDEWIYPDAARRLTTWDHLLDDFKRDDRGDSEASRDHARDIVRYIEGVPEKEVESRVDQFLASQPDYHYHTWTFESLLMAIERSLKTLGLGWRLEAQLSSYETWGEMIVVLRKTNSARAFLPVTYHYPEWDINQMNLALEELLPGALWEQSFEIRLQNLSAIDIRFGTFGRSNAGQLMFRLYSEHLTEPVVQQQVDVSRLRDNGFYRFEFPATPRANGTAFRFTLEAGDSKPGNAVTVWCAKIADRRLRLTLNGSTRQGIALNFKAFASRVLESSNVESEDRTPHLPGAARKIAQLLRLTPR